MLQTRQLTPETARKRIVPQLTFPIAALMAEVGSACDGPAEAMGERIVAALQAAAATPNLLAPAFCVAHPECYARHTVCADPAGRFTVVSLVWSPGQFSPPHAHDTWCAYAVVENTLAETLFTFDAGRKIAVPAGTAAREPGYACFAGAGLEQIHRLGNAGDVPAISIHVYGVEGSRVGTHVNRLMDVCEG